MQKTIKPNVETKHGFNVKKCKGGDKKLYRHDWKKMFLK